MHSIIETNKLEVRKKMATECNNYLYLGKVCLLNRAQRPNTSIRRIDFHNPTLQNGLATFYIFGMPRPCLVHLVRQYTNRSCISSREIYAVNCCGSGQEG